MTFSELMDNKQYKIAAKTTVLTGIITAGAYSAGFYRPKVNTTPVNAMMIGFYSLTALTLCTIFFMDDVHVEEHDTTTFTKSLIGGVDKFGQRTKNLLDDVFHFNVKDLGQDILDFIP